MADPNAMNGAIPPPPDGSNIVAAANPSTAPSADTQPGDTQPGSIPPPPDGSSIVAAPQATQAADTSTPATSQPDNTLLGSSALGTAATFVNHNLNRLNEGAIKPAVEGVASTLGSVVTRPIDYYHKAVAAAQTGDWATAAEEASKLVNMGMSDKDHPLYKAAENIIMQPLKQIEAQYKENRAAGNGRIASATNIPNIIQGGKDVLNNASNDIGKGDYKGAAADVVSPVLGSHAVGAIPLVGGAIQNIAPTIDQDIRKGDWGAVSGDAEAIAANILPFLKGGKAAEAGEAADVPGGGGGGAGEGIPPAPDEAVAPEGPSGPGGGGPTDQSSLTRAAQTREELNQVSQSAPSAEQTQNALQGKVQQAFQPQLDANNALNETANRNIDATAQSQVATAQAEQAQHEFNQIEAEREVDKEAALSPGDESITAAAKKVADDSNEATHDKYQAASDKMLNESKGASVDYENGAIHKVVQDKLGTVKGEGPLTKAVSDDLPGSARANKTLNNLSKIIGPEEVDAEGVVKDAEGNELTPEQYQEQLSAHGIETDPETEIQGTDMMDQPAQKTQVTMADVMKMYKKIGERQRSTGWVTSEDLADQGIYRDLKKAAIETIGQIAEKTGNPDLINTAEQMNSDYRTEIRKFENPAVKALRGGKLSDVDAYLTGKQSSPGNIAAMKETLGSHWPDFQTASLRRLIADSVNPDGSINYKGAVSKLARLKADVRTDMYGDGGSSIMNALNRAASSADLAEEAGGRVQAAQDAAAQAKAGVGKTVSGRSADINKQISDIIGNGDITELVKDPARRTGLQEAVGPNGMEQLTDMAIQQKVAEFSNATNKQGQLVKGAFNAEKFMNWYQEFANHPEAADALFKPTPEAAARYDKLIHDTQNVASVQKLVENGVIPLALGTAGGLVAGPWGILIGGLLRGGDAAQALKTGSSAAEWLANHPATWKGVELAGKVADAVKASPKGQAAAAKAATLKSTLSNTMSSLGGKPKKLTALTGDGSDITSTAPVLPPEVQAATNDLPVQTVKGAAINDPNNRGGGVPIANVDQGAGNNTIEVNRPQDYGAPQQGHELTHVWQNNLPPSVQAKIPDDASGTAAFDISDADKLRAQGKTLTDLPREKQATIVQKYIEDPKKNANLKPWINDMTRTALSGTMPTSPNATRLNTATRPPGPPDASVAGAYPKEAAKKKK